MEGLQLLSSREVVEAGVSEMGQKVVVPDVNGLWLITPAVN